MFLQLCVIFVVLTVCQAGVAHYPKQPALDYFAYPKYKYKYSVQDHYTGDNKSQHEERDGDKVKGSYQVADPDGTIRTVTYTADDQNGFNANVEKSGYAMHPKTYVTKHVSSSAYPSDGHHY